jgi:hypothetical protein
MNARSEDLPVSVAGVAQARLGFQEFLLAGERFVVGGLERSGAEAWFAQFYRTLPAGVRGNVEGYFRRQALLDLSQRTALLGPLVRLDISTPLNAHTRLGLPVGNSSVRSELSELFRPDQAVKPGDDRVEADAVTVRNIDLVLQEVLVEKSNDDTWFTAATDTVHLAVTSLCEKDTVRTVVNRLGSRREGQVVKFNNTVLATVPVDQTSSRYPRTYSFKIDAVEKDNGTYNQVLAAAQEYLQKYVTEKLIAKGIITAGGVWLGVPVPPPLADYLASYVKSWFDDALDWLFDLFDNDDDLIGTYTRKLILTEAGGLDRLPMMEAPFTKTFSGSGGRWRVKMCFRLR